MIRAILFDFYSVWTPDVFHQLMYRETQQDPAAVPELEEIVKKYYLGLASIDATENAFRRVSGQFAPSIEVFDLQTENISTQLVDITRYLHSHFLKVGMLANIGWRDYELLRELNAKHQLFESITASLDEGELVLSKEAFIKALQGMGEPPDSCLIVTGNDPYRQFAESYGLKVMFFQDMLTFKQRLAQMIENNK
jgi:FMN phosphatase YigB (HAD superfamily)